MSTSKTPAKGSPTHLSWESFWSLIFFFFFFWYLYTFLSRGISIHINHDQHHFSSFLLQKPIHVSKCWNYTTPKKINNQIYNIVQMFLPYLLSLFWRPQLAKIYLFLYVPWFSQIIHIQAWKVIFVLLPFPQISLWANLLNTSSSCFPICHYENVHLVNIGGHIHNNRRLTTPILYIL